MTYEWDAQRARRALIFRTASVVAATLVSVGVPMSIVIAALRY